ncbi:MAG: tRNA (N(6)-L-threonylcarbamoyladenosine(37)-C(2))-methylthiotransferase MtaB [Oscillospiraceae bacterium]|nr:tRNA (N(6)-L-threonylcarbamoyladenosine(37)-C(2))-methylthiotransferase MtaB [Oscillospiraceae bacterium]
MKIAIYTLGCKVNQYESQALSELLLQKGHTIVETSQSADAFIINSCTVTATGDSKSKKAARHFKKNNPDAVIALIGCFPQAFPQKAAKVECADIVLGNKDKKRVVEMLEECFEKKKRIFSVTEHPKTAEIENLHITSFEERTRAFVKIQDGCNRFCSYCIIPAARGRICSKPLNELEDEVKGLVRSGYSEIVLVGIDLSSYGAEFNKTLTDAVEACSKIKGVKRIRLGSLEPEIISDSDIERLSKIDSFCPQFHLSLQSGCDKTLKAMNRHYTADEYRTIVKKLRAAFPEASVTTDLMVGFAGETDEDFEESLAFALEMRFLKVHVFPYSIREGTRAAKFGCQISSDVKKERARKMIEQTECIRRQILNENLGKTRKVLLESRTKNGLGVGYTKDYIPVYIKNCTAVEGEFVDVRLTSLYEDGCLGECVEE